MYYTKSYLCLALMALGLSACSDSEYGEHSEELSYESIVHEIMYTRTEPAAQHIWKSAGAIITEDKEIDLSPTTEDQWQEVIAQAKVLASTGRELATAGPEANSDWADYVDGLVVMAELAVKAAQQKDSEALFEAGGRIYLVCKACHAQFLIRED